eukprot:6981613-Ditylum_brightwellii.AAC.1
MFTEEEEDDDNEDDNLQDLLALNRVHMIGMLLTAAKKTGKKSVIEPVNEESDSKSESSNSAFEKKPAKKTKAAKVARKAK